MGTLYDEDVIAWAEQQAALLRSGQWSRLDIDNIAGEIEDVGKSEKRALCHRMAVLVEHLIKCRYQPERCGSSWLRTIREQRAQVRKLLRHSPSLRKLMADPDFAEEVWRDAVILAVKEAAVDDLSELSPWTLDETLQED
ncbi:protein of unknown function DUF29 [Duganella sp. CF517]|uniref:DUF29 domain-containing protein n=1 Tax=Duganella sp. CF517 TaxID=1881038 RepID=UPI0008BF1B0B|nr:DUF29 domain-containing protein [Duganella sp. CF517]SEN26634.1 protein of unknown function DUF29 [Duganella sp. CF517]